MEEHHIKGLKLRHFKGPANVLKDVETDLMKLEDAFLDNEYKFGVLYVKRDQEENEMFTNFTSLPLLSPPPPTYIS